MKVLALSPAPGIVRLVLAWTGFRQMYYRGIKFIPFGFKGLLNIKYIKKISFLKIFSLLESGLLKKILSTWRKKKLHFVKWLWKNLLQMLSKDLIIFLFDSWDLASKLNYEKFHASSILLLKSTLGIFYYYSWFDCLTYYFLFNFVNCLLIWLDFL